MRPQIFHLCGQELEHEIHRETLGVALDLFVETFGGHAVKFGQIGIENDLLLAEGEDECFERRAGFHGLVGAKHGCE